MNNFRALTTCSLESRWRHQYPDIQLDRIRGSVQCIQDREDEDEFSNEGDRLSAAVRPRTVSTYHRGFISRSSRYNRLEIARNLIISGKVDEGEELVRELNQEDSMYNQGEEVINYQRSTFPAAYPSHLLNGPNIPVSVQRWTRENRCCGCWLKYRIATGRRFAGRMKTFSREPIQIIWMEIFSSNAIPRGSCLFTLFEIVLISTVVSLNMRMDLDNFLEQTKRSSLAFRKKQKEAEEKALRNNDLADKRCIMTSILVDRKFRLIV